MGGFLWGIFLGIVGALACYWIADRNNMNKVGWPILGFFLPILGIIITFVVAMFKTKDTA